MTEDGMEQKLQVFEHDLTITKTGKNVMIGFDFDGRQYNVNYTPNGWSTTRVNHDAFKTERDRGDTPQYFTDTAFMTIVLEHMAEHYKNVGIPPKEMKKMAKSLNDVIATVPARKRPVRTGLKYLAGFVGASALAVVSVLGAQLAWDARFPMAKYDTAIHAVGKDDNLTTICEGNGFEGEELQQCIDHTCIANQDTMMPGKIITRVFYEKKDGTVDCNIVYTGAEIEVPVKD